MEKYARTKYTTPEGIKVMQLECDLPLERAKSIYSAMLMDLDKDSGVHTVYDKNTSWTQYDCAYDNTITIFDCNDGSFHGSAWLYSFDHRHNRYVTISGFSNGYARLSVSHYIH